MKKRELSQSAKLKKLRSFGFEIKTGRNGKLSPAQKGKVTKTWKKIIKFVENEKQTFVWQKANKHAISVLRRGLSKEQFTPKGFFLRKPKGVVRAPKYSVKKDGTVYYHAYGKKGGRVIEEIHPIDPKLLAEEPPKAILALARRKEKVVLTVNGFDSSQTREYSIDALAFYIAQDLLPKFLDPNLDEAYAKLHGKKKRTIDEFVDIFHVKLTRYVKPAKRKNKK